MSGLRRIRHIRISGEDGEERMQSSDYRPEVRRHSVICQVSSVCTRLFTLCSHRASSDHRPPVSEAFVAAARAEGAGRGRCGAGAGHLVSGTASHAASNIIIRSHEGDTRSCSAFRDKQRLLSAGIMKYLRLWKVSLEVRLDWAKPRYSSSPARVLETTGGVDTGPSNTVRAGVGCWVRLMLPSVVLPRLKRPTRVNTIGGVRG